MDSRLPKYLTLPSIEVSENIDSRLFLNGIVRGLDVRTKMCVPY